MSSALNEVISGQQTPAPAGRGGKYLTFRIGREEYGLEILRVREIIGYMDITPVPRASRHIKGVINLRGQVIPVFDLRARLGLEPQLPTEQTCIIVVDITSDGRRRHAGIVVDAVCEVVNIANESIEETPQFDSSVDAEVILGLGKIGGSIKILLNIDKVLAAPSESVRATAAASSGNASTGDPVKTAA
jgi:purine-binding chemotaxis protein CheW